MAETNVQGTPAQAQAQQWWLVQDFNGAIGLVQGAPTNALQQIYVGQEPTFDDLQNKNSGAISAGLGKLSKVPGVSGQQITALISQLDHGAGLSSGLSWLYIGSDASGNTPSSNVTTTLGSEAQGTSLIPGTAGIVNSLSNLNLSALEGILGDLSFWKGVLIIGGGVLLLVVAAHQLGTL